MLAVAPFQYELSLLCYIKKGALYGRDFFSWNSSLQIRKVICATMYNSDIEAADQKPYENWNVFTTLLKRRGPRTQHRVKSCSIWVVDFLGNTQFSVRARSKDADITFKWSGTGAKLRKTRERGEDRTKNSEKSMGLRKGGGWGRRGQRWWPEVLPTSEGGLLSSCVPTLSMHNLSPTFLNSLSNVVVELGPSRKRDQSVLGVVVH